MRKGNSGLYVSHLYLVLYICSSPIALCLLYLWGVLTIGLASPIVKADAADHYIFNTESSDYRKKENMVAAFL